MTEFEISLREVAVRALLEDFQSAKDLRLNIYYEKAVQKLAIQLRMFIAASEKHEERVQETVDYPSTWWDHTKVRWFPRWLLKRFPPAYTTFKTLVRVDNTYMCPHLAVDPNLTHARWLAVGSAR